MNEQIIVTGAGGMLGRAVVKAAHARGLDVVALSHAECDIGDALSSMSSVSAALRRYNAALIINCAGIVPPMGSEGFPSGVANRMWSVNARGPGILAAVAARLVHISTDCVFDGAILGSEYTEESQPSATGNYAESKLAGEVTQPPHLTIRGSFIGLGRRGLVRWILDQPQGADVPGYQDWAWNGSYVGAFADRVVEMAIETSLTGLVHLPGPGVVSKGQLVYWLAKALRPDVNVYQRDAGHRRMVLGSDRIERIDTPWDEMIERLVDDHRHDTNRS